MCQIQNNVLQLSLKEKSAFALWCGDISCYFLDSTGFIFSRAPEFSGNVYKTFTGFVKEDVEGGALGKQFLSTDKILMIQKVIDALEAEKINISKINVQSIKETKLVTSTGTMFIVDIGKISDETMKNLRNTLASDEFNKKMPQLKDVEYIDVRFGGKVFFKLKGGDASSVSTSTKSL